MRQIKNVSEKLENVGDYAWIRLRDDEGIRNILVLRYHDIHFSFYDTCHRLFCGSESPRNSSAIERFPFLGIYTSSWIAPFDKTIKWGIEDLIRENYGVEYIGIIADDVPVNADPSTLSDRAIQLPTINDDESYISDQYTTDSIYSGYHGYHYHRGRAMNQPKRPSGRYRMGIELEVEFQGDEERDGFTEKTSNWFYCESDGSLGGYGCEIITIPLLPKDAKSIEFWNTLTDSIRDIATSWDSPRCGLHVHISREILGRSESEQTENLGKLLYLYHHYVKDTRMNIKIFGRERGYHDHDGKTPYGDAVKTIGSQILKSKDIKNKLSTEMIYKTNTDRYFDINIRNEKTIEFRKGKGSLASERIVAVVEYCELMCKYVKDTPWQQLSYQDFVTYLTISAKGEKLKGWISAFC